ncbi:MAG: hypothetical protein WCC97_12055 [Candidatus Acidiferrales bacterium]
MGPLLIFDKSFLQMLNGDEVFELGLHFKFVGTPTLIGEIIADLKLEPSERVIPTAVVQALSKKMQTAHGLQPANYRKLARANLLAHPISMIGQVVVDGAADNVSTIDGGKGLLYDSTPEQRMWARWAAGDFSTEDEETAGIWRNGIEQIDLDGVIKVWKEFSLKHFATTKNQNELIAALNAFLSDPSPTKQREILEMALNLAKSIEPERRFALALQRIGEMPSVNEFAPYAVSVLRLFLAFVCGLARGFVGPRPTNYIDLQYLYYAPFCMVFVSNDKFQRDMWGATSGVNSFVWGQDLKDDLRYRLAAREEAKKHDGTTPSATGSESNGVAPTAIADMRKKYLRETKEDGRSCRAKTFNDLEPEIQEHFKKAMAEFDRIDVARSVEETKRK